MSLIYKQMALVQKDFQTVKKDSKNSAQGFNFRGIDALVNAAHEVFSKHGVFVTTDIVSKQSEVREVTRSNGKIGMDKIVDLTVKYTFYAEDGSNVSSTIASEGLDSGDKATNKALSAALKYALIQTFQVPTQDMEDADKDSPEIQVKSKFETTKKDVVKEVVEVQKEETPAQPSGFRRKVLNAANNAGIS